MVVRDGDILVSTTRPHRGAIAAVTSEQEKVFIASTGFAVLRNMLAPNIRKDFLLWTLLSECVLQQLLQRSSGGNYPAIVQDELADIVIPVPSTDKQARLVSQIVEANARRAAAIRKADELLEGMDRVVFERLGIKVPAQEKILVYATRRLSLSGRIDVDFYSPFLTNIRTGIAKSIFGSVSISDICANVKSGFAAGKDNQAEDLPEEQRIPHLRPFSITVNGELSFDVQKYVPKQGLPQNAYCLKGEVLFNNTNSAELVGKTTVFDVGVPCACSNHVTRMKLKPSANPYYVAAFFNALRGVGYWKAICTFFNNQAGVNVDTLKETRIVLPERKIQDEIAKELHHRKTQALALRTRAVEEWTAARAQFEKELLGG